MTRTASGTATATPKRKFWKSPVVRLGGSALILALLLTFLPFGQVWSAVKRIPSFLSLGLLCVYLALHLLGVLKWRLLTNLAGANLTFRQAARCYYGGLFGNVFLPSLVGGDFVRAGMAFSVSRSKAAIILGSLIDRIQDVIGLGAIAGVGVLTLPRLLDPRSRRVFWTFGAVLVVAGIVSVGILYRLPARKFSFKARRLVVKLRRGFRSMYAHPYHVLLCLCIGITLQVSQVAINALLGQASGLHIGFGVWLFAWPLAKISALLPVTQGGIGVREVALVGLLAPFGAPPVPAAAAGLVFEAITTIGGLIAGLIAFLLGGFPGLDTVRAPTKQPSGASSFPARRAVPKE